MVDNGVFDRRMNTRSDVFDALCQIREKLSRCGRISTAGGNLVDLSNGIAILSRVCRGRIADTPVRRHFCRP